MKRGSWSSKFGFVFAAAGSAVGLANIWRFPYVVGENGGALFILAYLFCLFIVGFPVFLSEVLIGRTTQKSPSGAFETLSKSKTWGFFGKGTIFTGFLVSCFYSAIAAWVLGYLVEATRGNLTQFSYAGEAITHHDTLLASPLWTAGYHALFQILCLGVLLGGVRGGIEKANKVIMPLLYLVLCALIVQGLFLPGAVEGLKFLFYPDLSKLSPWIVLVALGQAFFTLSLGQGTMVTYGSYLSGKENLWTSCIPVALMDTLVSLLSAIAVFTIAFSAGVKPGAGEGLLFHTLPLVFSTIPGGATAAFLFFLLVFFAALTSEISAMEPSIAYLVDRFQLPRKKATFAVSIAVFLVGLPFAFASNLLNFITPFGMNLLELIAFGASSILIPIGGLAAVLLVGWKWGIPKAWKAFHGKGTLPRIYFTTSIKWVSPVIILGIFINALGLV